MGSDSLTGAKEGLDFGTLMAGGARLRFRFAARAAAARVFAMADENTDDGFLIAYDSLVPTVKKSTQCY